MNRMRNNCKLCGKKSKFKCMQCGKVSYCSRECQFKDWIYHKSTCHNYNILSLNKKMNSPSNINYLTKTKNDLIRDININNNFNDINNINNNGISITEGNNFGKNFKLLKQTQKNNVSKFPFMKNLKDIMFMKLSINSNEEINEKNLELYKNILQNKKILLLYDLLKKHRKYIIENVLLDPNKTYFFATTLSFKEKYIEIENYIFNFIFLIKFLYELGDKNSLFKAKQALNYLTKELLDYKNEGLLTYSINTIFKRCFVVIRSKTIFQNIAYCYEIIKKYLLLISCLMKVSKQLELPKLYYKFIDHYGKIFDLALKVISTTHSTEKIILKSNLLFNIGNLFVQKNLLNSSIKLYKEVINIQTNLEPYSFVFGASYYNLCILYYVMGNMKNCEMYLNDLFEEIEKCDGLMIKTKKHQEDFLRFKSKLLLFSAEVNMEKENYSKAIDNLKEVINHIETTSQKERHKTQQTIIDKKFILLGNICSGSNKNIDIIYNSNKKLLNVKQKNNESKSSGLLRDKEKKVKYKINNNDKSSIEYLYDVDFFNKTTDKLHFNEKIKEYVNGFLDAILFLIKEKEIKLRENQGYQKRKRSKRNNSDKKFFKLKSPTVIYSKNGKFNLDGRIFMERSRRNEKFYSSLSKSRKKIKSSTLNVFNKKENNLKEKNERIFEAIEEESRFIHEKTAQNILTYFNNEMTKKVKIINNEGDISDFKYFLMLLTSLSYQQLKILNSAQNVNMSPELLNNLPIYFNRQFKNTLSPAQRNLFDKLRLLSLIRCKVLANPNKKISLRNINFNIFHTDIILNDVKFKQYSDIANKIREIIDSGYGVFQRRGSTKFDKTIKSEKLLLSSEKSDDSISGKSKAENNFIKEYISLKSKKNQYILNLSDSIDSDEYRYFKFENKFDLEKFRGILIEDLISNYYDEYPEEDIDNMKFLIESPMFVQLLNSLNFDDILDLDRDHSLLFELLQNEIKKIEGYQYQQNEENEENEEEQKSEEIFLSSDSSHNEIEINIDEKDLETI